MMPRAPAIAALIALLAFSSGLGASANEPSQLQIGSVGIPNFDGSTGWINSRPLTLRDLRGKVVLVDFFDYSCLNCLRTLPYLREWYRRYRKDGFEIIGVQTPSFYFSGDLHNVEAAVKRLGITWPVVLDGNAVIWKHYHNSAWPQEYLFAPDQKLLETAVGEGGYPDTERTIQHALKAMRPNLDLPALMALLPQDSYDKPGAICYPQTPEIVIEQQPVANHTPSNGHRDGAVYLTGDWRRTGEAVVSQSADGSFQIKYHAIQADMVMRPESGAAIRTGVTLDGKPVPKRLAGTDVKYDATGNSYVEVDAARDYDIIGSTATWGGERELRLTPQRAGLAIYDVAFESCEVPAKR